MLLASKVGSAGKPPGRSANRKVNFVCKSSFLWKMPRP
jgi:hypothetical protein